MNKPWMCASLAAAWFFGPVWSLGAAEIMAGNGDSIQWTVRMTYQSPVADSAAADEAERVEDQEALEGLRLREVTVSGPVRREVLHYSDGATIERWAMDGWEIRDLGYGPEVIHSANFQRAHNYRREPFPELAWVADSNREEVVELLGRECNIHRFREEDALRGDPEDEDGTAAELPPRSGQEIILEAYMDARTGLPVAMRDGGLWSLYEFQRAEERIRLPPAYQEAWREHQRGMDRYHHVEILQ